MHRVNTPIRLYVLGTNVLFRECLTAVLDMEGDFEVTELATDLERAKRELARDPPDLLLADVSRSSDEIFALVYEISRISGIKFLLVGAGVDENAALTCIESGAHGYISLSSSFEDLRIAIRTLLEGGVAYSPEITPYLFSRLAELSREERLKTRLEETALTTRELEVLSLIAQGLRNKDLADKLSLSLHTVKNHVYHLLKKLKATDRREAVRIASQKGWILNSNVTPRN